MMTNSFIQYLQIYHEYLDNNMSLQYDYDHALYFTEMLRLNKLFHKLTVSK